MMSSIGQYGESIKMRCAIFGLIWIMGSLNNLVAASIELPDDGWVSWQVAAVEGAPNWCCFHWNNGKPISKPCNLDSRNMSYGSSDETADDAAEMRIYALMENGELQKIRTFETSCPVKAKTDIANLGIVPAIDSVNWLAEHFSAQIKLSSHILAAVAVHADDRAREVLVDIGLHDSIIENRKGAVFWMGQLRALETAAEIRQIMFADSSAKVREHAAFSISQSQIPERAAALIELANTDSAAKVRAQAWFWLTQTAADESESAIFTALNKEPDQHVQQQAIFALSQLPKERAFEALTQLIEDQSLSRKNRKQALFWLAQSESAQVFDYMDSILSKP